MALQNMNSRNSTIAIVAGSAILAVGIAGYSVITWAVGKDEASNLMLFVIPVVQILFGQPAKNAADDAAPAAANAVRAELTDQPSNDNGTGGK